MRPLDISGRVVKQKPKLPQLGYVAGALAARYPEPPSVAPYVPARPPQTWADLINAESGYQQDLANILADSVSDRSQVQGSLRQGLVRYGGGSALRGILQQLGAQPGWEDLLDEATIGGAQASDTSGTSIVAQLEKMNKDRLLAEKDVRAAKGILSSGQSGYEIGEARQDDTINRSEAVNQLLDFLRGGIGGYASREGQRNAARAAARNTAAERLAALGIEPDPGAPASGGPQVNPAAPMPAAPPVSYAGPAALPPLVHKLVQQLTTPRKPIGGWE